MKISLVTNMYLQIPLHLKSQDSRIQRINILVKNFISDSDPDLTSACSQIDAQLLYFISPQLKFKQHIIYKI
jgi:hypothetical protein